MSGKKTRKVSEIRLIVNADDLGTGSARDRGILRAFRDGIVTSASLMANGSSFPQAAREALAEGLPVGVHLNLSEGRPLAGPIRGLTTQAGDFPGKVASRRRLRAGHVDIEGIYREISAQILRTVDSGLSPDHLDTHQHTFLFPVVTRTVEQAAADFGIRAVRLPCPAEPATKDPGGRLGGELVLYRLLAPAARASVRQARLSAPDGLWGMPLLGRLNQTTLLDCLRLIPPGTWELMVHPGVPEAGNTFSGAARGRELAALLSPASRSLMSELNITPITFRDLACVS